MTDGFFWKTGKDGLPTLCISCGGGEFTQVSDSCFQVVHGAIVECKACGTMFHDTGAEGPHNEGAEAPEGE